MRFLDNIVGSSEPGAMAGIQTPLKHQSMKKKNELHLSSGVLASRQACLLYVVHFNLLNLRLAAAHKPNGSWSSASDN